MPPTTRPSTITDPKHPVMFFKQFIKVGNFAEDIYQMRQKMMFGKKCLNQKSCLGKIQSSYSSYVNERRTLDEICKRNSLCTTYHKKTLLPRLDKLTKCLAQKSLDKNLLQNCLFQTTGERE